MEQYNVGGMSCAACSARVEKAVSSVPGVTSCSVNLLMGSMGVEGTANENDIISAVEILYPPSSITQPGFSLFACEKHPLSGVGVGFGRRVIGCRGSVMF